MTFTSDLQLSAQGLYPVEHMPLHKDFAFIGRMRDGREFRFTIVAHPLIDDARLSAQGISEQFYLEDIIGWKHA